MGGAKCPSGCYYENEKTLPFFDKEEKVGGKVRPKGRSRKCLATVLEKGMLTTQRDPSDQVLRKNWEGG